MLGKSSLAVNIAQFVATQKAMPIAIFSLEMVVKKLQIECLAHKAGLICLNKTIKYTKKEFARLGERHIVVYTEAPVL